MIIESALKLGSAAFARGLKRVPACDIKNISALFIPNPDMTNIMASEHNLNVLRSWVRGWDSANLNDKADAANLILV